jgi:NAD(P)-dependent dehydrogenase (short-subunit alcohol dehydrogenase family)
MRRVLITGGGTGIGRALAHAFAEAGDAVTITGRRMAPLEEAASGHDITPHVADVTSETDMAALFNTPFDVVIANAGAGQPARLVDLSLEDWQTTLDVNLTGTFLTFRAALRAGLPDHARLIAIASTASLKGNAMVPAYTAAKHGVLGLVRSVALDIAKTTATCNAICPGFVDTDIAETAITGLMEGMDLTRGKATQMLVSGNPQRRLIAVEEVAEAALYLASRGAASVNGHALSVSGGET